MSSSVGMMTFPIYGKIKKMFQTTNQLSKHQIFTSIDYGHSVQRWTACEHLGKTAPDRFIRDPTRIRWQWLGVRGQKSNTAVVIHGVLSKTRNFLRAAATGRHGGWRNEHLYNSSSSWSSSSISISKKSSSASTCCFNKHHQYLLFINVAILRSTNWKKRKTTS